MPSLSDSIAQLATWLDSPVYDQGVLLYGRLIGEDFLLRMFRKRSDDYNRSQLTKALTAHYEQLLADEKAQKAAYPETLKTELSGGGKLMDERTIIKQWMRDQFNAGITESPELKAKAFRVLAIKDELDGIYGRKSFYEQNGFLPDAANTALPEAISPADLLKRRNTVRTYVTKHKKELAETFNPDRIKKLTAKLEGFQTELAELDNHLSLLSGDH